MLKNEDIMLRNHIEEVKENGLFLSSDLKKLALSTLQTKVYIPSLNKSFGLDDAIRIGVGGVQEDILTKRINKSKNMFCLLPK